MEMLRKGKTYEFSQMVVKDGDESMVQSVK